MVCFHVGERRRKCCKRISGFFRLKGLTISTTVVRKGGICLYFVGRVDCSLGGNGNREVVSWVGRNGWELDLFFVFSLPPGGNTAFCYVLLGKRLVMN